MENPLIRQIGISNKVYRTLDSNSDNMCLTGGLANSSNACLAGGEEGCSMGNQYTQGTNSCLKGSGNFDACFNGGN